MARISFLNLSLKGPIILASVMSLAGSAEADGLAEYKDFVSNPPLIKKIVFGQSGNLFAEKIDDGPTKILNGFVLFEGAIQSKSWYLLSISNSPFASDKITGDRYVVGKSLADYWQVNADRKEFVVTPLAAKSSLIGAGERRLIKIREIQRLGLIYLEPFQSPDIPASIVWPDKTNFTADTASHGVMTGQISSFTNGYPDKVDFQLSGIPNTIFTILYSYRPDRQFPPYSITAYKNANGNRLLLWTFTIDNFEPGALENELADFSPTNFMTSAELAAASITTSENGHVTIRKPDGKTVAAIAATPQDFESMARRTSEISGHSTRTKTVRIVFWSLLATIGILLGLAIKRSNMLRANEPPQ